MEKIFNDFSVIGAFIGGILSLYIWQTRCAYLRPFRS